MSHNNDKNKNLYYLEELSNYKVASDYYDVRGWDVIDAEKRTVGKVSNLLVHKKAERVAYLDVEVNETLIEVGYNTYQAHTDDGVHGFTNKDGEEHLIVPIGMVSLDKEQKRVITNQIDFNTFAKAKRFKKGSTIDRDYELMLFRHYMRNDEIDTTILDEYFYKPKEFDDSLLRKETK